MRAAFWRRDGRLTQNVAMSEAKRPSLDVLRTFLAVYRSGSFSDAARTLSVSQPTVTNHVGALEAWFERKLFVRSSTGVSPTPFAQEVESATRDQIDHLGRLLDGGDLLDWTGRSITIGGPIEFMTEFLIPAVGSAGAKLPNLELAFGRSAGLLDDLANGRLDLVVSTIRPQVDGISSWPIYDEELFLVSTPRLAPEPGDLAKLRKLPIVSVERNLPIVRRFWNVVFDEDPSFRVSVVAPSLLAVRSAVVAGLGISVLPGYLIHDQLADGSLVSLATPEMPPINTIFLAADTAVIQRHEPLQAAARLIVARVRQRGREQAPA